MSKEAAKEEKKRFLHDCTIEELKKLALDASHGKNSEATTNGEVADTDPLGRMFEKVQAREYSIAGSGIRRSNLPKFPKEHALFLLRTHQSISAEAFSKRTASFSKLESILTQSKKSAKFQRTTFSRRAQASNQHKTNHPLGRYSIVSQTRLLMPAVMARVRKVFYS